jgi:hypothetical protein
MESVCRWTKAISDGPDDNPGHLGQFSNIFINYTCLQCNTHTNCPSYLLHTSWEVFPGGPRLPLSVRVSTSVTSAGSQIFFTNYSSLLNLQSYIEPSFLLWILWGISKIMGSVLGWIEVILVSILICDTTWPKGMIQGSLTGQSIWDRDSIYWSTR